jgi:hypothetical protein
VRFDRPYGASGRPERQLLVAVVEPMTTESASSAARCSAGSLHLCCTLPRSVAEVRLARTWHALGASEKRDLQLGGKDLVGIRLLKWAEAAARSTVVRKQDKRWATSPEMRADGADFVAHSAPRGPEWPSSLQGPAAQHGQAFDSFVAPSAALRARDGSAKRAGYGIYESVKGLDNRWK